MQHQYQCVGRGDNQGTKLNRYESTRVTGVKKLRKTVVVYAISTSPEVMLLTAEVSEWALASKCPAAQQCPEWDTSEGGRTNFGWDEAGGEQLPTDSTTGQWMNHAWMMQTQAEFLL